MIDDGDINGTASEYVLGTLDASERASVQSRRVYDRGLDASILEWENRLAPLADLVAGISPPAGLFAKIVTRIDGQAATVVSLRKRVNFWRRAAVGMSAIAATLLAVLGGVEFSGRTKQHNLVAVLQKDASSPAFLVTVNIDDRVMTIQPIAAKPEAGKSYELWLVQDSLGAPKSLGVIDAPQRITRPILTAYRREVIETATFAVSLEPEGGSPTGAPTGPVVFSGKLLPSQSK
jgi:anti-sigma-K factor RskA